MSKNTLKFVYVHSKSLTPLFSPRLLVGAPRATHRNQLNVTGVVYQCDLSAASKRCEPIEFNDEGLFSFVR